MSHIRNTHADNLKDANSSKIIIPDLKHSTHYCAENVIKQSVNNLAVQNFSKIKTIGGQICLWVKESMWRKTYTQRMLGSLKLNGFGKHSV